MLTPILIHNVLAQPVVPRLQLIANDLIHLKVAFDVSVPIQPRPLIIDYYVLGRIYVPVAQIDPVVHATLNHVALKYTPATRQYHQATTDRAGDVVVDHFNT